MIKKDNRGIITQEDIQEACCYIHHATNKPPDEIMRELETSKSEVLKEAYMTSAEILINQGKQEGIQEGMYQTIRGLKTAGVPMELIVKATGLSEEKIKQI
ncbi:MAG: hypothetical protein B0D92_02695 [Spirochaeta sp. LUC14_002_19_P3]|nr:MAG: hypothetical protein B0D92_02695 [Spirochaeta sp. LUC14_002_19_P3]